MNFTDKPFRVIFYEKHGCSGNEKQKKLLSLNGITFETKSILNTPWTKEQLNSFFKELKKEECINKFAPDIKNNIIDINSIEKDDLISLMIDKPILIKRPLIEIGKNKLCGFDIEKINELLKINICDSIQVDTCTSSIACKSV